MNFRLLLVISCFRFFTSYGTSNYGNNLENAFVGTLFVRPAFLEEQKVIILVDGKIVFAPTLHGSVLLAVSQSTGLCIRRPFQQSNHSFLLCVQILTCRNCQKRHWNPASSKMI